MDVPLAEPVAVGLCLVGSAVFSASETALTSLSPTRVEALRGRVGPLARAGLTRWIEAPQSLLVTILIGNNLVNVLASALATDLAQRLVGSRGLASAVGVMTLAILVFGEITPKSLARLHAEAFSRRVAGALYLMDLALRPVSAALGSLAALLSPDSGERAPVTEEDVRLMLMLARRHRQLPVEEVRLMERVLRFREVVAREMMVPRPWVRTLDVSWDLERVRREVLESGHSRFPVVDGSPDAVVGVLHAKDLLRLEPGVSWRALVREPLLVPETRPIAELLERFRSSGQHLAVVLDEYGGLAGVLTLEDAVEYLVGEIRDEFDREGDGIVRRGEGYEVPGRLSLRRLEALVGHPVEPPEGAEVESVGGLVAALLGGAVEPGARSRWAGLVLEVVEAGDGRARRVLVIPAS